MSDITSLRGMLYNNMPDQYKTDSMNNYLEENALELAEAAALNEATYYGKNKYLIQIEQIFQEMCDDYQSRNQMTDITSYCNDKRFTKVGKLFAKCFGFKDVVINAGAASILSTFCNYGTIINSKQPITQIVQAGAPNAFTVCNSHITKLIRNIKSKGKLTELVQLPGEDRQVIKITEASSYKMDMCILPTLFYNHGEGINLTGAEITAICCHEIGHNFYKPSPARASAGLALDIMGNDFKNIILLELFHTGLNSFNEAIPDSLHPIYRAFFTIPAKIFGIMYSAVGWIFHLVWAFDSYKYFLMLMKHFDRIEQLIDMKKLAAKTARATIKYDDEKFSDSFATAYGYGPELYRALDKLSKVHSPGCVISNRDEKIIRGVVDNTKAVLTFPLYLLRWYLDPHGSNETRLKNILDYMEASNLAIDDAKLREEYDKQLKDIQDIRKNIRQPDNLCPANLRKSILVCLQDMTNCSDPRELFSNIKPKVKSIANLDYAD